MLQEAGFINRSLYVLGKVIAGLVRTGGDLNHKDVPYRDSKLTKLLIASLGGRSRTMIIACVSEAGGSQAETLRTLKFSMSCARIKNRPVKLLDPQEKLILDLRSEIKKLKSENKALKSSAPDVVGGSVYGQDEDDNDGVGSVAVIRSVAEDEDYRCPPYHPAPPRLTYVAALRSYYSSGSGSARKKKARRLKHHIHQSISGSKLMYSRTFPNPDPDSQGTLANERAMLEERSIDSIISNTKLPPSKRIAYIMDRRVARARLKGLSPVKTSSDAGGAPTERRGRVEMTRLQMLEQRMMRMEAMEARLLKERAARAQAEQLAEQPGKRTSPAKPPQPRAAKPKTKSRAAGGGKHPRRQADRSPVRHPSQWDGRVEAQPWRQREVKPSPYVEHLFRKALLVDAKSHGAQPPAGSPAKKPHGSRSVDALRSKVEGTHGGGSSKRLPVVAARGKHPEGAGERETKRASPKKFIKQQGGKDSSPEKTKKATSTDEQVRLAEQKLQQLQSRLNQHQQGAEADPGSVTAAQEQLFRTLQRDASAAQGNGAHARHDDHDDYGDDFDDFEPEDEDEEKEPSTALQSPALLSPALLSPEKGAAASPPHARAAAERHEDPGPPYLPEDHKSLVPNKPKASSKPADDGYTPSYAPSAKTSSKVEESGSIGAKSSNPVSSRAGDESEPDDYGIYNDNEDEDSASGTPLGAKKEAKAPAKASWAESKGSSAPAVRGQSRAKAYHDDEFEAYDDDDFEAEKWDS